MIGAVYGTYKLLQKLKVKVDKRFFIALLPYIIYGGWTRALKDHALGVYSSGAWWWCSPPIYFIIFAIALGSLLLGITLQKRFKISYHYTMLVIGIILLFYNASITEIANTGAFVFIILLVSALSSALLLAHRLKPGLLSLENTGIAAAHLLDAGSSFTAISFFGYYEQHVLPSFLINLWGPWTLFPMKLIVVLPVLYFIDKEMKDKQLRGFLKIIVLILGLALGIRDLLTVSMLGV